MKVCDPFVFFSVGMLARENVEGGFASPSWSFALVCRHLREESRTAPPIRKGIRLIFLNQDVDSVW